MECSDISAISNGFSTLSLISWMCAQLPQIYTNFKNKSADGISPTFLILWFLGDFLSLTSCLLNDIVLKFQIYLSLFFLANDSMLCFQYYYYNSVYPRTLYSHLRLSDLGPIQAFGGDVVDDGEDGDGREQQQQQEEGMNTSLEINKTTGTAVHIRSDSTSLDGLKHASNSPSTSYNSTDKISKKLVAASFISGANALNIVRDERGSIGGMEKFGLFLAWLMTIVYMSSRCPQLYKNYQRKSVDGINPILFGSALLGNLTYTLSILTSCEFLLGDNKNDFIFKELPYILGSSGTIIFDVLYFYQRYIYRGAGRNTHIIGLENWQQ